MKSSRRKQTNPNRVAAGGRDADPSAPKPGPTDAESLLGQDEGQRDVDGVQVEYHPKQPLTNGPGTDFELPLDMSVISSPQCAETFLSHQGLQDHKLDVHGPDPKKPRLEVPGEDFPTAYHRLGRELQEITEVPLTNGHPENEESPALPVATTPSPRDTPQPLSSKLPSEKADEESAYTEPPQPPPPSAYKSSKENGEPMNGKSDRIFHMDAYCELCDREFCNKYFLKTHKANKHGIYEDNSPPASSVPVPFPGLMMPQDPLASFNFKMDSMKPPSGEPLLPWSFKLDQPSQQPKKSEGMSLSKPHDSSLPMFPMPLPSLESPKPSIPKSSNSNSGSLSSSNTSSATSILTSITNSIKSGSSSSNAPPANDPSMEDYCHICQKHFCNKYYLKKHKQDVHGIAPENPPSSSNRRSKSSLIDLPMTSTNPMILPQPLASLAGMHNLPGMHGMHNMPNLPNMPNMPPGVMVINPYSLPPVAIIPAGSLMPGQQLPPPPHPIISQPMNVTPLPDSALLPPAPPTPSSSSGNANSSAGLSPNKRSPSVPEGGVHCNICSKEFCNEFYLQIHKESKHGIKRNNEESSREKALSLVKESMSESSRSSPPPLSSISRSESHHRRSPGDRSSNEGMIFICNLCNKDFGTNKYLYRIHRIHDHGLTELMDPTIIENGELPNKEDAMRSMNESLMRMAADASAVGYASGFGNTPSNKPQESAVCEICNKEMTNQYFLRLHKFNVHGIDPSTNEKYDRKPISSPIPPNSKPKTPPSSGSLPISSPNQQPLNLTPHHPGKPPMLPFLPPKMDFKDMPPFADFGRDFKNFRDMPSFLTDTISNELFARSQNPNRHMDLNFFGLPSLGKMPGEDNVKLNFDPEAYCDICKKEFCSKYFLRTHKQNIHGIKSDVTSLANSKTTDNDKINAMSPLKTNVNSINGKPKDTFENKSSWRWKEPVNSSRVVCDICNKEVCNKYFLRTHKQKKHGIPPSSLSPNVSMSGSPVASDCDTASNASSQPDEKPFRLDPFSLPQMIPLPPTERLSDKFHMKPLHFGKPKEEMPLNNNTEQSETCNICNRRFKNLKWLKDHIVKDHSGTEALDMRSKNSPPIYTCQVCGVDFPAELSVQLHLIQEHNARVTLDTEEPQIPTEEASLPNGEGNNNKVAELSARWGLRKRSSTHRRLKKYICSRCGFDTHWLSSLLDHERTEHGVIADPTPAYSCKRCHQFFPSPNSLSAHTVTVHGLSIDDALKEVKNAEPESPNSFKCSHCPAVFPTRSWGMAHVRHVHIRSRRDLAIKNSFEKSLLRCPSCPFKTHFAFRLQRHVKCRHRSSLRSGVRASRSICSSEAPVINPSSLCPPSDAASPNDVSTEDNLVNTSAMYKSIAASLLSAPEAGRLESPESPEERDEILLQSYKLPIGSSPVDSAPFKMAAQTSAASAVVGL